MYSIFYRITIIVFTDLWIHGSTSTWLVNHQVVSNATSACTCKVLNKAFILINALLNKHKYQDTPIYKAWSYHLSKVYAIKWQSYLKCIHLWLHEFHICTHIFPCQKFSYLNTPILNENQESVISLSATYLNCFVSCTR